MNSIFKEFKDRLGFESEEDLKARRIKEKRLEQKRIAEDKASKTKEAELKIRQVKNAPKTMEFKCVCNQCNKIWHYLPSKRKDMEKQLSMNRWGSLATAGSPFVGLFASKTMENRQNLKDLDHCPNCGSGDIKKTKIFYHKQ